MTERKTVKPTDEGWVNLSKESYSLLLLCIPEDLAYFEINGSSRRAKLTDAGQILLNALKELEV